MTKKGAMVKSLYENKDTFGSISISRYYIYEIARSLRIWRVFQNARLYITEHLRLIQ